MKNNRCNKNAIRSFFAGRSEFWIKKSFVFSSERATTAVDPTRCTQGHELFVRRLLRAAGAQASSKAPWRAGPRGLPEGARSPPREGRRRRKSCGIPRYARMHARKTSTKCVQTPPDPLKACILIYPGQ